ncbi:putative outer membrane protein [Modicisalibacter xianhensis]|uniref:Putative outer membrane protein n=1 Tax=Modicisalibacter xianhensis TaxID=442341 RepID=A0A4R8F8D1_9GAMM|nr:outer membrane beta-barrel protein [Halomonas xianhensis]TDX21864.1 putative outer membrane protein [Halomonas xianhensis]
MQKKLLAIATVAAITGVITSSAQAASGYYVFGEYSYTEMGSSKAEDYAKEDVSDLRETTQFLNDTYPSTELGFDPSYSSDDSDNGFSLGIGYRFHKNFAAELAYRDLGETSYGARTTIAGQFMGGDSVTEGKKGTSYESSAWIIRGVGILPVTDAFALEALLGAAYVDTDYTAYESLESDLGGTYSARFTDSDKDWTVTYGLGASYSFTSAITAYARWERIHNIDTADNWDGIEADSFSGGLRYAF